VNKVGSRLNPTKELFGKTFSSKARTRENRLKALLQEPARKEGRASRSRKSPKKHTLADFDKGHGTKKNQVGKFRNSPVQLRETYSE